MLPDIMQGHILWTGNRSTMALLTLDRLTYHIQGFSPGPAIFNFKTRASSLKSCARRPRNNDFSSALFNGRNFVNLLLFHRVLHLQQFI